MCILLSLSLSLSLCDMLLLYLSHLPLFEHPDNVWCKVQIIKSYNKSQQDALFLNFILVKDCTCFGQIYCPSSGVLILYSQQLVYVILVMLPSASEVSSILTSLADIYITSMTNTYCCEYSIKTPDDGQYICPKHVEFFTK